MQVHTKKHPTENIRFIGSPEAISRLRKYASTTGATELPTDSIPATEVFPDLLTNPAGIYLKGSRYREDLTQVQLAETTGIPRRHISEMESGKRAIGKERAKNWQKPFMLITGCFCNPPQTQKKTAFYRSSFHIRLQRVQFYNL